MRRFTWQNVQHSTYRALCKLGKALMTGFLCGCLRLDPLRREIHEGLQGIETSNSANDFVSELQPERGREHITGSVVQHCYNLSARTCRSTQTNQASRTRSGAWTIVRR